MSEPNGNGNGGLYLSKGILWLIAGLGTVGAGVMGLFMAAFVPWAAWTTVTLMDIKSDIRIIDVVKGDFAKLEERFERHVLDDKLHHHISQRVTVLERFHEDD